MAGYYYSSSLLAAATIGFNQTTFSVREDGGQVDVCVEISGLLAATEVSLTVSLEGVSSGKAGRNRRLLTNFYNSYINDTHTSKCLPCGQFMINSVVCLIFTTQSHGYGTQTFRQQ